MEREMHKRNMLIYCYLFIFMAVLSVVRIFIEWNDALKQLEGSSLDPQTLLIATIIITVVVTFFELFLGIKGICQANGNGKIKSNIVVGKIAFVICAIGTALVMLSVLFNHTDIVSVFLPVACLAVIYSYIQEAKVLKAMFEPDEHSDKGARA